jgi:hypothetical protein
MQQICFFLTDEQRSARHRPSPPSGAQKNGDWIRSLAVATRPSAAKKSKRRSLRSALPQFKWLKIPTRFDGRARHVPSSQKKSDD